MKRTKLEEYLAILETLQTNTRPLKPDEIENTTRIRCEQLEKDLTFLLEQNAVQRKIVGTSEAFFVAPLGNQLVQYFSKKILER